MTITDEIEANTVAAAARVASSDVVYAEINDFLVDEAWLLDEGRLVEWLETLTPDISYVMPNRKTVYQRDGSGFDRRNGNFRDDLVSLSMRIRRLMEPSAWERDPAPRVRRLVTNLVVHRTGQEDTFLARSYVMLLTSRFDDADPAVLSVVREDVIRRTDAGLRLAARTIYADSTVYGMPYVTSFL